MHGLDAATTWWRPDSAPPLAVRAGSRVAFGGLVVFSAILMLSPQSWFPVLQSLRIAFLAAALACLAHVSDRAMGRRVDAAHPEVGIALVLVGWAAATIPFSSWPGGSFAALTDHFMKAVVFFWLISALVTTDDRLRWFTWVLVACSVPLSVTALRNFQTGVFLQTPAASALRIEGFNEGQSGLAGNPNDLALTLNLMIPLAGALCATARHSVLRAVSAAILVLSAAGVIVTFSRAGFVSLAVIALIGLVTAVRRVPLVALAIVLVFAVGVPSVLPAGYLQRLGTIADISSDPTGSAQGRWSDLAAAARVVMRHPLTGVGLGQNILALNQERGPTWREMHNVYLQYALDLGVPGLLFFLWLFAAVFRKARLVSRLARHDTSLRDVGRFAHGVQVSLAAFAVAAVFYPVAYQFYFFLVAGLALAVMNVCRATVTSRLAREGA